MSTAHTFVRTAAVTAVLALAGLLSACDNTVDPFIESDRHFTIFGYLDTGSDTQFVRVIPFRKEIGGRGADSINVEVTATTAEGANVYQWRDSVITYADGSIGHVFYSPFRPIPGQTYRFRVERPNGDASWAETTVPPIEDVEVDIPPPAAQVPISHDVTWHHIEAEPFRVEVWYRFSEYPPYEPFKEFVVTYEDIGRAEDDNWTVRVNLSEDLDKIINRLRPGATLLGVGIRLTMSDDAWRPPGVVFDPEILVQPGTFSNVENGFGFLGSVNQYTVEWVLHPRTIEILGFAAPGKGGPN